MASDLQEAFSELKAAQNESTGRKQLVWIGRKSYPALVETLTESEIMVAGGVAESGGFKASIAVADFGSKQPKRFVEAKTEGSGELQVLSCNTVNGVTYDVTVGDPIEGQQ